MIRKILFLSAFALTLTPLFFGGSGGCNTNEVAGHGDDDSVVGTEQDAKDAVAAAENVAFRSFTAAFGSPGAALVTEEQTTMILEKLKSAITATTRSSCAASSLPNPSGDNVTINGSVGGSCAAVFDGDSSDGRVRANCTNYDDGTSSGEATVSGLVGALGSTTTVGSESTFNFSPISTNLLVLTFANGNNCSALVNTNMDVTIDNDTGTGSLSVSGCVSVCGEAFDVTGSETF